MTRDFYNYVVYDDGKVYSKYWNKFLKGDIVHGYLQYSLYIEGKAVKYKAHRLVALLFIDNPNNYPIINHKDGNKLNNHFSNLEWCTHYHNNKHARDNGLNDVSKSNAERWKDPEFRERTRKHFSQVNLRNGSCKGERNPRFKYRIYMGNDIISRKDLAIKLNISLSYCDTLIRRASSGKSIDLFETNDIKVKNIRK